MKTKNNIQRIEQHIENIKSIELEKLDEEKLKEKQGYIQNVQEHFSDQWETIKNEEDLELEGKRFWAKRENLEVVNPTYAGETTEEYIDIQHKQNLRELEKYEEYLDSEQEAYENIDKLCEEKLFVIKTLLGEE